jgi:hypothetical protein
MNTENDVTQRIGSALGTIIVYVAFGVVIIFLLALGAFLLLLIHLTLIRAGLIPSA